MHRFLFKENTLKISRNTYAYFSIRQWGESILKCVYQAAVLEVD